MDKSSSEPVLHQEDYAVPYNGVGDTGHPKRVLYCNFSKDDGKHSSRIAQIIRQAEKVPGPGKYVAHEDWKMGRTSKFAKGSREYKSMHKGPAGGHYEDPKEFHMHNSVGARDNTSNHPRVAYGKLSASKRRSFLDGPVKHSSETPGPIYNAPPGAFGDRLGFGAKKVTSWDKEKSKAKSLKVPVHEPGPNHYSINYARTMPSALTSTVPKGKNNNFIDKCVREKLTDVRTKKEYPGPGTYDMQNFNLDKTTRGTFHCQLRNLSRSACSGYF